MRWPLLLCLSLAPLAAASAQPGGAPGPAAVTTTRELWAGVIGYITTAAEEASDTEYGYRPVATVRSFGQLVGHLAGSQFMFCAAALGEPPRAEDAVERAGATKAELVAALRASTEYGERAYRISDQEAAARVTLFGQERTKLYALGLNATHDGEHYGNLVTYLRMQGKVPPSSRSP